MGAFTFRAGTGLAVAAATGAAAIENGDGVTLAGGPGNNVKLTAPTGDGDTIWAIAADDNAASVDGSYYCGTGNIFTGTIFSGGTDYYLGKSVFYMTSAPAKTLATDAAGSIAAGKIPVGNLLAQYAANATNALLITQLALTNSSVIGV